MRKSILVLLVFAIMSMFMAGCYWNDDVLTDQVGARLNKNAVEQCVGPGVYTDLGWFADLKEISIATLTFEVSDPEVATSDNQLVGVKITIQARRKGDCDSVKAFLSQWSHLQTDEVLVQTVDATAREGIKNGVRGFTLTELLNDRNGLAEAILGQLTEDANKYHTEIVNVTIENIAIDKQYSDILQRTAEMNAEQDYEMERQALIEQKAETDLFERQQQQKVLAEQLLIEEAQTLIDVEIAERAGAIIEAEKAVYSLNAEAFELEMMRLLANVVGEGTVYFLPVGTDLTTIFADGGVVPLISSGE